MMPVEPRCAIRDEPGLYRDALGTTKMNRGSTGKVLKCLIPQGVTGKDRQRPVRHREQPGRHRSSTGANAELRQHIGCRRWCRYSYGTSVNRRSVGTPPMPGLRLSITGDDRG
ncbi:hypothetical protein DPMN_043377 [Dreissena polymorpha]|uniref:Uncharacterized protein n=1 Tax=Dreissena polymorpha TaxID=45954 RepID=A0A9D4D2P6_DREPO|nr:hypothetical protein DPMN_043377 [Dreissena polymorpha]